jgi:ABC-2 type transport system ATP-binding protein
MDLQTEATALRPELETAPGQAIGRLAELASRYANDRTILYRTVLLKRAITLAQQSPSREQIRQGVELLDQLIADQTAVAHSDAALRRSLADAARARALEVSLPSAVVFSAEGLGKTYRRSSFQLSDVTIQARYGEIIGVVGRNGNGKTTLFRTVVGELRPSTGELVFPALQPEGGPVRWSSIREQIAYVPQDLPRWHGSLRSNLHYEAAFHGIRGGDNEREVDYIVERLGLRTEVDKRWHELSGGYKLRFALARALVWKPKLLVLDEPLANLDIFTQQIILKDLRHLTDSLRYPLAVLISSQHLHEIEEVSDKLLLLSKGTVRYFGTVDGVGVSRTVNRFELGGSIELPELEAAFKGLDCHSLSYTGVAYVLTTSTTVTSEVVLRRALERSLPLTYFRDISKSVKSLLQDEEGT